MTAVNGACWYGEPHGPMVHVGLGTGTSSGAMVWGPLMCQRCGSVVADSAPLPRLVAPESPEQSDEQASALPTPEADTHA